MQEFGVYIEEICSHLESVQNSGLSSRSENVLLKKYQR